MTLSLLVVVLVAILPLLRLPNKVLRYDVRKFKDRTRAWILKHVLYIRLPVLKSVAPLVALA